MTEKLLTGVLNINDDPNKFESTIQAYNIVDFQGRTNDAAIPESMLFDTLLF